jgi:hypothetical protein
MGTGFRVRPASIDAYKVVSQKVRRRYGGGAEIHSIYRAGITCKCNNTLQVNLSQWFNYSLISGRMHHSDALNRR